MGAVLACKNEYDLEQDDKRNSTSIADNVENADTMFELTFEYLLGGPSIALHTSILDGWIGVMIAVKTSQKTAHQCWTFQAGLGLDSCGTACFERVTIAKFPLVCV